MHYEIILPPPSLAPYVRFLWIFEAEVAAGAPYVYRSMADGCAELLFHYRSAFAELVPAGVAASPVAHLHGPGSRHRRFVTESSFGIFGAYLYPFAIPQLLGLPADEAANQMPDLQTLLGARGRQLEEQVMLARDNPERLQLLTAFLEERLPSARPGHASLEEAVREVLRQKGRVRVQELADGACLSRRQFERRFKELAGFSPKLFSRITRFHAASSAFGSTVSMAQLALDCGYYDQSHFIHEFREFSGHHPSHFFSGPAEGNELRAL